MPNVGVGPITLRSTDGRTVRVEFGPYSLSESEAHGQLPRLAVRA